MAETLHFFPNKKLALRFCIAEYLKPARSLAVASVHLRPISAEEKRASEVRQMLAEGKNPFALDALKARERDGKGKQLTAEERERLLAENRAAREAIAEPERVKALESKWAARHIPVTIPVIVELDGLDIGPSADPDDHTPKCSFCGKPVDEITATKGKGKTQFLYDFQQEDIDGEKVITEKLRVIASKLLACPDCVLYIQPVLDKDGNIIKGTGVQFPESPEYYKS